MPYTIFNRTRERLIADQIELADTAHARRVGLLKHERLEMGRGLLIPGRKWLPFMALHTFKMKFSIDVFFLDENCKMLRIDTVQPDTVAWMLHARWALETAEGTIAASGSRLGDEIILTIN